jgi:hypothetical protein
MIATSRLSIKIVRYLDRRAQGALHYWISLGEISDHVCGSQDIVFGQAVDLARCRGWILAEGNSAYRRACLTKAGCWLVLPADVGPDRTASCHHASSSTGERDRMGDVGGVLNLGCVSNRARLKRPFKCQRPLLASLRRAGVDLTTCRAGLTSRWPW